MFPEAFKAHYKRFQLRFIAIQRHFREFQGISGTFLEVLRAFDCISGAFEGIFRCVSRLKRDFWSNLQIFQGLSGAFGFQGRFEAFQIRDVIGGLQQHPKIKGVSGAF